MANSISRQFNDELGTLFQSSLNVSDQSASQKRLNIIRNIALGTLGLIAIAATGYYSYQYFSQPDWPQQPDNIPLPAPTPPPAPTIPVSTPTIPPAATMPLPKSIIPVSTPTIPSPAPTTPVPMTNLSLQTDRLPENDISTHTSHPLVQSLFSSENVATLGLIPLGAGSVFSFLRKTLNRTKPESDAPKPAPLAEFPAALPAVPENHAHNPKPENGEARWNHARSVNERSLELILSSHRTASREIPGPIPLNPAALPVTEQEPKLLVRKEKSVPRQYALIDLKNKEDGTIDPKRSKLVLQTTNKKSFLSLPINAIITGQADNLLMRVHPQAIEKANSALVDYSHDQNMLIAMQKIMSKAPAAEDSSKSENSHESDNSEKEVVVDQVKHSSEPQSELLPQYNSDLTKSTYFGDIQTPVPTEPVVAKEPLSPFASAIFAHVRGEKRTQPAYQPPVVDDLDEPNINMQEVMERCVGLVRTTRTQIRNREFPTIYPERGLRLRFPALAVIGSKSNKPMVENDCVSPCLIALQDVSEPDELKKQLLISQKLINEKYKGDFHGVDNDRGGKVSLLNIMLEGAGCFNWTGPFGDDSQPQWFAMPHGPCYIMLDKEVVLEQQEANDPLMDRRVHDETTMKAFLVPNAKFVEYFNTHLDHAVEHGFITNDDAFRMKQKLITYDEFLGLEEGLICNTAEFKTRVAMLNNERA